MPTSFFFVPTSVWPSFNFSPKRLHLATARHQLISFMEPRWSDDNPQNCWVATAPKKLRSPETFLLFGSGWPWPWFSGKPAKEFIKVMVSTRNSQERAKTNQIPKISPNLRQPPSGTWIDYFNTVRCEVTSNELLSYAISAGLNPKKCHTHTDSDQWDQFSGFSEFNILTFGSSYGFISSANPKECNRIGFQDQQLERGQLWPSCIFAPLFSTGVWVLLQQRCITVIMIRFPPNKVNCSKMVNMFIFDDPVLPSHDFVKLASTGTP